MRKFMCGMCVLCIFFPSSVMALTRQVETSQIPLDNFSVEQLQQAAEAGDPDAQYALGYMYYYGKKVSQNQQLAINWMRRASVQGQEQASHALMLLGLGQNQAKSQIKEPVIEKTISTKKAKNLAVAKKSKEQKITNMTMSSGYTIQLLNSSNKQKVESYIKQNNLQGKASYAQNKNNGKASYSVIYGNYKTRTEAQAALAKLPTQVRTQKPWVKSLAKGV
jgi:septal ring-binding cell division protein DamX